VRLRRRHCRVLRVPDCAPLLQVKVLCQFRGREMEFKQIAIDLFNRFLAEVKEEGMVESGPSLEGRSLVSACTLRARRLGTRRGPPPEASKQCPLLILSRFSCSHNPFRPQ
jgi:Translation initiation factor IF-3, C-terminal domain